MTEDKIKRELRELREAFSPARRFASAMCNSLSTSIYLMTLYRRKDLAWAAAEMKAHARLEAGTIRMAVKDVVPRTKRKMLRMLRVEMTKYRGFREKHLKEAS